jgi:predicted AAA+ superfamily ATPase
LDFDLLRIMHPSILELLAQYLVLGGMPKVVDTFVKTGDWEQVRQLQREIINAYDQDMSKHAPLQQVPRLREVWRSVPLQLAEENQKFTYGHIKSGARGRDYEYALLWLGDCGLVHKLNRLSKVEVPLKAYEDFTAFKVFLCDVGLLSRINDVPSSAILNRQVFGEFRGSLTEQFVLQEMLAATNYHPGYWSNVNSRTEIDFIVQDVVDGVFQAILIEVKSGVRLQSRSLSAFMDRHHSRNAVRFSQADHKISVVDYDDCTAGRILDLPLYCVSALGKALQAAR